MRLLSVEIDKLCSAEEKSKRVIVCCGVVLQRDCMLWKGAYIHHLLRRRMEAWRQRLFDELVHKSCHCALQSMRTPVGNSSDDHILKVFTRLMLQGQV